MRFPETSHTGGAPHTQALENLELARKEHEHVRGIAREFEGTPDEARTADALVAAGAQVVARRAWVDWIERGV
jgi:hypothetical protein